MHPSPRKCRVPHLPQMRLRHLGAALAPLPSVAAPFCTSLHVTAHPWIRPPLRLGAPAHFRAARRAYQAGAAALPASRRARMQAAFLGVHSVWWPGGPAPAARRCGPLQQSLAQRPPVCPVPQLAAAPRVPSLGPGLLRALAQHEQLNGQHEWRQQQRRRWWAAAAFGAVDYFNEEEGGRQGSGQAGRLTCCPGCCPRLPACPPVALQTSKNASRPMRPSHCLALQAGEGQRALSARQRRGGPGQHIVMVSVRDALRGRQAGRTCPKPAQPFPTS